MTSYKGDILPKQAWEMLKSDPKCVLVDVRTSAEWHYIGYPDLSSLNKSIVFCELRTLPDMDINPSFTKSLSATLQDKEANILFLCRTGGRSREAAIEMTKLGYNNCYNISDGFEGSLDTKSHRGKISGWKADTLPWRQS